MKDRLKCEGCGQELSKDSIWVIEAFKTPKRYHPFPSEDEANNWVREQPYQEIRGAVLVK